METQTLHLKSQPHMKLALFLSSNPNPPTPFKLNLFQALKARAFSSSSSSSPPLTRKNPLSRARAAPKVQVKGSWLESLTCPIPNSAWPGGWSPKGGELDGLANVDLAEGNWVVGIDPDVSGAVALLRPEDGAVCSAQVFDSPHLPVMVGKRVRKRLDVKSIVQLLRSFDAPHGTTAYIEQSIPFPQDGKLGWWGGGFNYGVWIGALVASGFTVVPVPSTTWKNQFQLSGNGATKDDSRRIASTLFPSLSSSLQRKKDHGRAEALLIASYGDLKIKSVPPSTVEQLPQ